MARGSKPRAIKIVRGRRRAPKPFKIVRSKRRKYPVGKEPIVKYPQPTIYNMGGHMINPPDDCPYRFVNKDGGEWVDRAICIVDACGVSKECTRRAESIAQDSAGYFEELKLNGVWFSRGGFKRGI